MKKLYLHRVKNESDLENFINVPIDRLIKSRGGLVV